MQQKELDESLWKVVCSSEDKALHLKSMFDKRALPVVRLKSALVFREKDFKLVTEIYELMSYLDPPTDYDVEQFHKENNTGVFRYEQ